MPEGRRCVKFQWVFIDKEIDIFAARLVVCEYNQVPGIDFIKSYTTVINDMPFRIIVIGMMVWNIKRNIIDIEASPLHNGLNESILMKIPSEIKTIIGECLVFSDL